MAAIRGKHNKTTEMQLMKAFARAGIGDFSMHSPEVSGCPDFFFTDAQLAIFVDGCFWHGCPKCGHIPKTRRAFWKTKIERNRARHKKIKRLLNKESIKAIRIWEHSLRTGPQADRIAKKISILL